MEEERKTNRFLEFFKYKEKGATLSGDLIGGLVTFLAMCYILPVNSSILSSMGMDAMGVFASTAIVSALVTILMGLFANAPIALSAGMGLNAFLAYTVCGSLGYSWQESMLLLTITGIVFFAFSLTPIRKKIIAAFPKDLKCVISAGLGAFIAFVGLKGSGIIAADGSTFVKLGSLSSPSVILAIVGIFVVLALMFIKTKRGLLSSLAVPISMLAIAVIGYIMRVAGVNDPNLPDVNFQTGWGINGYQNVFFYGVLSEETSFSDVGNMLVNVLSKPGTYAVIFSLIFVNLFDTTATLMAVGRDTGVTDSNGDLKNNRAIVADAVGALVCAPLGTATVTSFAESTVGVKSGARTGLASLLTGSLFLISAFVYPLFQLFTASCVSAAALVSVGALIFASNLGEINWKEPEISFSAFITVIFIVLTYSLTNGIGFGLFAYIIISIARGKWKRISWILYLVAIFYLASFAVNEIVSTMVTK